MIGEGVVSGDSTEDNSIFTRIEVCNGGKILPLILIVETAVFISEDEDIVTVVTGQVINAKIAD